MRRLPIVLSLTVLVFAGSLATAQVENPSGDIIGAVVHSRQTYGERIKAGHPTAKLRRAAKGILEYDLGNGNVRAIFGPHVAFQDTIGVWQEAGFKIYKTNKGWATRGGPLQVRFATSGNVTKVGLYRQDGTAVQFTVPRLTYDPGTQSFSWKGWRFKATETNVRLESDPVPAPVGVTSLSLPLDVLGVNFAVDGDGNLAASGGWNITRPVMLGADTHAYPCSAWTYSGGAARLSCDDSTLPARAYPYIIDPSASYYPGAGSDDAYTDDSDTVYPPAAPHGAWDGATSNWIIRSFESGTTYKINLAFVRMNTSALPDDATITSATLNMYTNGGYDDDNRGIVGEYYSAWGITGDDWTATASSSAWDNVDYSLINGGKWTAFPLKSADANISKTGYTGFRIHVSGGIPNGRNQMRVDTYESSNAPYLTVAYTLPPPPAMTGSGNGTVSYSVSGNQSGSPRQGTITIGDKTFTVTQSNNP